MPTLRTEQQGQNRGLRNPTESFLPKFKISTGPSNIPLFSGALGQDARRWMGRFKREVHKGNDTLNCADWLDEFNCALKGDAAEWADTDYQVSNLLTDESIS
jgi:hypothetical protein